ncbi:MAG: hypothetical protein E7655_03420 [Ruminococcaceae bacterium]|nr:hypothetical protein [Oscillospiraceae bacterium]
MKKCLIILLSLLLVPTLFACDSPAVDEGEAVPPQEEASSAVRDTEAETTVDAKPADPLASVDWKEEQREAVVAEMVNMATLEWRPKTDIDLTGIHSSLSFSPRSRYVGMPYVNKTDTPYDDFVAALENGLVYTGPTSRDTCMGVDCSSSIFLAYEKILGIDVDVVYTQHMIPGSGRGFHPVGLYDGYLESYDYDDTRLIIDRNSEQAIFEAYALLKKGDTLVRRLNVKGHSRMVYGEPVIVRTQGGKIVPEKSYITFIDQNLILKKTDDNRFTTWTIDEKWTFADMAKEGYIPVTVEPFYVDYLSLTHVLTAYGAPDSASFKGEMSGMIVSTDKLNSIKLKIFDAEGKEVASQNGMMQRDRHYFDLSAFDFQKISSSLEKGKTYTLAVSVKTTEESADVVRFDFTA